MFRRRSSPLLSKFELSVWIVLFRDCPDRIDVILIQLVSVHVDRVVQSFAPRGS